MTPAGGTRQELLNNATYYPFGPVATWSYGNGRPMQRVLDQDYRPLAISDTRSGGLSTGFAFDPAGNLSALTAAGNTAPVVSLDYDALGRLTAFKDGPTGTVIDGYSYDATGNRLSAKVNTITQSYTYPTTNHRLSAVAGTARTYDAIGNTLSIGGTAREFVYDANGRMGQAKRAGAVVMNYQYNGRGEQVRKFLGTASTYTLYDETGHWLGDYDSTGQALQQAIWLDDLPAGVLASNGLHYVQPDHLGSPRAVIDPVRDVAIWTWDLKGEAFGKTPPNQDPDGDGTAFAFDMRFPGQRYDAATGLNQNYFRDYDTSTGRYGQSDPIGLSGGVSTYSYVKNIPISLIDPFWLQDAGSNPKLSYYSGLTKRREEARPDYLHLSVGVYVGTTGLTWTRNGTLFLGFGFAKPNTKSLISGKVGYSFSAGKMTCESTPGQVDEFVTGATTGFAGYYGVGGGYVYNTSGSAIELGVGSPGAALQPYEYMIPIWSLGVQK